MNTKTAGVRHDYKTDQYVPTVDGKDVSPTSFDKDRALQIAKDTATRPELSEHSDERPRTHGYSEPGNGSIREIAGYPDYLANDAGHIESKTNWRGYGTRELAECLDRDGYPYVRLQVNGKRVLKKVHSLVCLAFHGEKPTPQHEVRHLDGSKSNNVPENLCWGTRQENADDRLRHGNAPRGEKHSQAIKAGLRKSEISPLPWSVDEEKANDKFVISDNDGNVVALVHAADDTPEGEANAAYIVQACNEYPKLLAACKSVVDTWESDFKGQETGYEGTPLESDYKLCKAAISNAIT